MPTVSVIIPVYNVERFVEAAIASVQAQTFQDFELIIVDDGGQDRSIEICRRLADQRTRIIEQKNRGLAGARNTGIAAARGRYIALLDADDFWHAEKLARHVAHLESRPQVGVSYAGSILIDEAGHDMRIRQRPVLGMATARQVFCGQTVKNGSVPVFRRAVFDEIAYRPVAGDREWYFDETLRRSEDVECWTRTALTSRYAFEGIRGDLTYYRINSSGLSADIIRQLESWEEVCDKIAAFAPDFIAAHEAEARARELRYLARRAVQLRDTGLAVPLIVEALKTWPMLALVSPLKTATTLAASLLLRAVADWTHTDARPSSAGK